MPDAALPFVLDELDTGIDPYLVAAAAYALRSSGQAMPAFAPFVMHALANIRYRDDPVSLDEYGGYAVGADATSPVVELLRTLAWLGPDARGILTELEPLGLPEGGLPRKRLADFDRALAAIHASEAVGDHGGETCCTLESSLADMFRRVFSNRPASAAVESIVLEDQNGDSIRFDEFFVGQPSIVVFFYTRCDNPFKCSLTVTKLARIQKALEAQGFADRIRTAAITYDPGFRSSRAPARVREEPWGADGRVPSHAAARRWSRTPACALRVGRELHRVTGEPTSHRGLHSRCERSDRRIVCTHTLGRAGGRGACDRGAERGGG